ncbi:MAG TPA: hypothetical protein VN969_23365 [Streptosporangiaceae bacterium]|nr:hypothetical protein [Streptosporangiaceae bacterium]
MIRRAFWLGAGAAAGILGYRRVEAIGRKVVRRVPGTVTGAGTRKQSVTAMRLARESLRFTRDVREGMEIYSARQNRSAASTLSKQQAHTPIAKDGR